MSRQGVPMAPRVTARHAYDVQVHLRKSGVEIILRAPAVGGSLEESAGIFHGQTGRTSGPDGYTNRSGGAGNAADLDRTVRTEASSATEKLGVVVAKDAIVPTRDGVRLATDFYMPARDGALVPGKRS